MKPRAKNTHKQLSLLSPPTKRACEHGGSWAVNKRRAFRPMNPRLTLHITLKSQHAVGGRCLFRHKKVILRVMRKAQKLFHIKVYEYAFAGNHMHLLVKGFDRESLQNFFRVFAGHTAQGILKVCPLPKSSCQGSTKLAGGAPTKGEKEGRKRKIEPCKKNQRRFWSFLLYSRLVSWGREFKNVMNYIEKNTLETLKIIAYELRGLSGRSPHTRKAQTLAEAHVSSKQKAKTRAKKTRAVPPPSHN